MRLKRYARRTEETYFIWIRDYFRFAQARCHFCPKGKVLSDSRYLKDYLVYLAMGRNVSVRDAIPDFRDP
ncbi:phage integrase N-terminal SAM-like domain-containing protein [Desulfofustis limnaeus]|uniref:phage integrase N-terminal SAM-like domain-containing protein n=1 Tax=Desulfofustis limnaeus TaxID=2740163 RepID=UPI00338D8A6C